MIRTGIRTEEANPALLHLGTNPIGPLIKNIQQLGIKKIKLIHPDDVLEAEGMCHFMKAYVGCAGWLQVAHDKAAPREYDGAVSRINLTPVIPSGNLRIVIIRVNEYTVEVRHKNPG